MNQCPVERYREYAEFQFAVDGEGFGLRDARQALAEIGEASQEVVDLDELVIEAIKVTEYINPILLDDPRERPLESWWWHLGKLRSGVYPAQLLPQYLRDVYLGRFREAA